MLLALYAQYVWVGEQFDQVTLELSNLSSFYEILSNKDGKKTLNEA